VVVVEMGVKGGPDGNFRSQAQSVELKRGAGGRVKAFDEKGGVFAYQESAVAGGLRALGWVGDGGVDACSNFASGGEALISERWLSEEAGECSGGQGREAGGDEGAPGGCERAVLHDTSITAVRSL